MWYSFIGLVAIIAIAWYRVEGRDKRVNSVAVTKESLALTGGSVKWLVKDIIPLVIGEYRKSKADYDYFVEKEEIQPVVIKEAAGKLYEELNKEITNNRLAYNKKYVKVMESKTAKLKARLANR